MKQKVTAEIHNMPREFKEEGFLVVRRADDTKLWYYGFYRDKDRAISAARMVDNGLILEVEA